MVRVLTGLIVMAFRNLKNALARFALAGKIFLKPPTNPPVVFRQSLSPALKMDARYPTGA